MKNINVTEARRNLLELIKLAERGEYFTLTREGKVVAQLTPPRKTLPSLAVFRRKLGKVGIPSAELLRTERSTK